MQYSELFIVIDGLKLVVLPFVREELLYFFLEILVDFFTFVESLQKPKELNQFVSIFKITVKVFKFIKDFVEIVHDQREN